MTILKAEQADLPLILNLQYLAYQKEAKLFNNPDIPPLRQTLKELQEEFLKGLILKAVDETGRLVGSVRARCENGTVFIGKLMVHPEKQRKGIGSRLLKAIEQEYPEQRYELFTSTRSADNLRLYLRHGYRIFKEKAVYGDLSLAYLEKIVEA